MMVTGEGVAEEGVCHIIGVVSWRWLDVTRTRGVVPTS